MCNLKRRNFVFIEELYYGNLEPQEYSAELKSELKKKHNELTQIEKELIGRLADADKDLFSEYADKYLAFLATSITDGFINGFRFGAKFALDTFMHT